MGLINHQHPVASVLEGERLIKNVYETIRQSKHWESSVLIITYDEHGGFYDHVVPPEAVPPGDSTKYSINGFEYCSLCQNGFYLLDNKTCVSVSPVNFCTSYSSEDLSFSSINTCAKC